MISEDLQTLLKGMIAHPNTVLFWVEPYWNDCLLGVAVYYIVCPDYPTPCVYRKQAPSKKNKVAR